MAVVLQKNVLFSGTILENLRWGNQDATEEECRAACRAACADEFIERLPHGYHTFLEREEPMCQAVRSRGCVLPGALLKNPRILILDDSTSAVDTATEAKIRECFRTTLKDTTKFIIAQRIGSVEEADQILVMDEGQIVGMGSHRELLASCEAYQEIYYSQKDRSGEVSA